MRSKGSNKSGCRKLHVAAFYLELATVKKCLKAGDDPNGTRDLSMVDENLPVDATPLSLVFIALLNEHILGGKKKLRIQAQGSQQKALVLISRPLARRSLGSPSHHQSYQMWRQLQRRRQ